MNLTCFKAYDIRGKLGDELNTEIAYRIGRATAQYLKATRIAVGGDVRLTSEGLKQALANGILDAGCDVIDLGVTGTEETYFAAFTLDIDGAIEVTASHNPMDYNGMKLVGRDARPISGDSGLNDIRTLAEKGDFSVSPRRGTLSKKSILDAYVDHLLTYIKPHQLRPLKLVVNAGNGAAGHVIDVIEQRFNTLNVPVEFIKIHHEENGNFPNGIPNPLLPENRDVTSEAVKFHHADMGIAWDGDFDRCFLFDENGIFIEGYYIVGLLAEAFLVDNPHERIIHDPRLTWNTIDIVEKSGGIPVQSKTGHAFIKERMRSENAIYGGEMSAHHYFRDFGYCDSGMIPWLLVINLLSLKKSTLSSLVAERVKAYPCSGEINYRVDNALEIIKTLEEVYVPLAVKVEYVDGLSIEMNDWRFNVRISNTEPLLRLNVESKNNISKLTSGLNSLHKMINNI
ncbi:MULTISPECIES: phosphomannomutase [Aeromonas]|uniref:phosphomannomutase n=1 Tax=Aeromonas TaxID=642 RepID=UPI0009B88217|nr:MULTISPECIES: phosphomannomutase [Aeromonas]ASX11329.1 phosphomannomutase CpsG [Aeromonas dhakensis]MBL0460983.1 phosphomannomutase CpsG [Aeromonas dhakensis]MBL0619494.1 phosphomannomutase CpsG [Aeromonas dhakensis]QXC06463.1 phosphomannomutase CpsG [Aeromonas sp. FDAARGOS 1408]UCM43868.1 phosphomannomutase CpsG [Aeromonas dhakensis]